MTQPSATSSAQPGDQLSSRKWPFIAVACFSLLALLPALLAWALYTEAGSRSVWTISTQLLHGQLSGQLTGGTIAHGLRFRTLQYKDDKREIVLDALDSAWQLSLSPLKLTIERLNIERLQVNLLPAPPEPLQLPTSLQLPFCLELKQASINSLLLVSDGSHYKVSAIALHANSDKTQHTLVLEHADTDLGKLNLGLDVQVAKPFKLNGYAKLNGEQNNEQNGKQKAQPYAVDLTLAGVLQEMRIVADIRGGINAHPLQGQVDILATPFAAVPIAQAQVHIAHINLAALTAGAPRSDIAIDADLTPITDESGRVQTPYRLGGLIRLRNDLAGSLDKDLLPIVSIQSKALLSADSQQLTDMVIQLAGGGELQGSLQQRSPMQGEFSLQAKSLNLARLHAAFKPTKLNGPLAINFNNKVQTLQLKLADADFLGGKLVVNAHALMDAQTIRVDSLQLQTGHALLAVQGSMARDAKASYVLQGALTDFNPQHFMNSVPSGNINAAFNIHGAVQPQLTADASFHVHDSKYAGLPMSGKGSLRLAGKQLLNSDASLEIAGNSASIKGSFGMPNSRLYVRVDAPALQRLGMGLAGALRFTGDVAGSMDKPRIHAEYTANQLEIGQHKLASATGQMQINDMPGAASNAKLTFTLHALGYRNPIAQVDKLDADLAGSYASHRLQLQARGKLHKEPFDALLAAQGSLQQHANEFSWQGMLTQLDNLTTPRLHLQSPMSLSAAHDRLGLGMATISLEKAQLHLQHFAYAAGILRTQGRLDGLDIADMLKLRQQFTGAEPPLQTDLVLDASWNLDLSANGKGFMQISRRQGDIRIPVGDHDMALGLETLQLRADLSGRQLQIQATTQANLLGSIQGQVQMPMQVAANALVFDPQAPIRGGVQVSIPALKKLGLLLGAGVAMDGRINADIGIGGRLDNPTLSGNIEGNDLALTLYDAGIRLRDGVARIALRDNVLELSKFELHGGKGLVRMTGSIPLAQAATRNGNPDKPLTATLVAEKLELLSDPSAQLTLSGKANISNSASSTLRPHLVIAGKFTVDQALFNLPETAAPKLGDDVVVIRGKAEQAGGKVEKNIAVSKQEASPYSPAIDLDLDLGRQFRFSGLGANLRLAGVLNIKSLPQKSPQARGTLQVAEGVIEAFGTKLAIERGILNFQGALDNPSINILAMRRKQEVPAGVQVTGTAERPQITLVSEPDMANEQKLSWLVFGRASGGNEQGQAQAAAQGAALALLNSLGGKTVAQRVGLDEISLGTNTSGQQLLNLGKAISNKLSIGYKQGLTSTESAIELTYLLSRNWSVVTQGGRTLGLNIFYSKRFDSIAPDKQN